MNFEYQIAEQDFIDAQALAIKNSPVRLVRWTRFVLPLFGAGLLAFLIRVVVQQGFSWRIVPASIFPLVFLATPLLSRRNQRQVYAKTTSLHGTLSLVADEDGLQFQGPTFSSRILWAHFYKFLEDERSFLLYQSPHVFNIVPKRGLSTEQIDVLRTFLRRNVSPKS